MLDWTDRHCRSLLRCISRQALLYTEMVTTAAILNGKAVGLQHDASEHPLALQLGGSDPAALASCARIGAELGFQEINLNVGCPSDRVQSGRFGACLMAEPDLVAECVGAMCASVTAPVTVKTRIGIDRQDDYESFARFVATVAAAGCKRFIIHARAAWLQGLSPAQNRNLPPLRYAYAYRLKQQYPGLCVILNGGIEGIDQCLPHLQHVDGVMLGRAVYHDPYLLAAVDNRIYGTRDTVPDRAGIVRAMYPYIERELSAGTALKSISRHMLGLFHGQPGARHWRRHLSEFAVRNNAGIEVIEQALDMMARFGYSAEINHSYREQHG